jgi:hypothetical protein
MLEKQQNALYPNLFGMILSAYKRRIKNSFLYPKYSKDMTGYTKSLYYLLPTHKMRIRRMIMAETENSINSSGFDKWDGLFH